VPGTVIGLGKHRKTKQMKNYSVETVVYPRGYRSEESKYK
jgi:hypothetical protein